MTEVTVVVIPNSMRSATMVTLHHLAVRRGKGRGSQPPAMVSVQVSVWRIGAGSRGQRMTYRHCQCPTSARPTR